MTQEEQAALKYMHWHVAAYGSGAPADEIADKCGMTLAAAKDMLDGMQMRGVVAYRESDWTHGWHEAPNDQLEPLPPAVGSKRQFGL